MDRYAVVGNPVAHSLSPQIHAAFAEQLGEALEYTAQELPLQQFKQHATEFFAAGGKGLNVTVPFKEQAWELVDEHSLLAKTAGAVNTIKLLPDGRLHGANTDGLGLCRDLFTNLGWQLRDARILLVGAGGAARGVVQPLLLASPASLTVVNRTRAKADALAGDFAAHGNIASVEMADLEVQAFDLVINATSASFASELPELPPAAVDNANVYDMVYAAGATGFLSWAADNGALQLSDGLGMLVEQAAEAFQLWRGERPDTAPVLQNLRDQQ